MNARIKKEMRPLQTMLLVTAAAAIVGMLLLNGHDASGLMATAFAGLSAVLGVACFGTEFNARTMGFLLAQPMARRRLWQEKMTVLGAALVIAWLVFLWSTYVFLHGEARPDDLLEVEGATFLLILIAFCSAPYFTLECRNFIGGVAFTLILPPVCFLVLMSLAWLGAWLTSRPDPWFADSFNKHPGFFLVPLTLIYCAVTYALGYRKFLNYQDVNTPGTELKLPEVMATKLASILNKITPGYTGPLASLIRKELQVQRATFLVAGILAVLIVSSRLLWLPNDKPFDESGNDMSKTGFLAMYFTIAFIAIYLFSVPIIAGLVSMAEERNWGTVGWQFTLPVSLRKQSLVKLSVTYLTTLILGVLLPLLVVLAITGPAHSDAFSALMLSMEFLGYLVIFSLVVFASSVSTNTMRALVYFFGLLIAVGAISGSVAYFGQSWVRQVALMAFEATVELVRAWADVWHATPNEVAIFLRIAFANVSLCALLALIGSMILQNYRVSEINARRRWLQSFIIAAGLVLAIAAQQLLAQFSVLQNYN